jgi:hypothetical protein
MIINIPDYTRYRVHTWGKPQVHSEKLQQLLEQIRKQNQGRGPTPLQDTQDDQF